MNQQHTSYSKKLSFIGLLIVISGILYSPYQLFAGVPRCEMIFSARQLRPTGRSLQDLKSKDILGSVVEIGAGIGGSNTLHEWGLSDKVAYTVSPYAMSASNARYGEVPLPLNHFSFTNPIRLKQILDTEYAQLNRLPTAFSKRKFVLANVATTERGSGIAWIGISGQKNQGASPTSWIIKVKLENSLVRNQKRNISALTAWLLHVFYEKNSVSEDLQTFDFSMTTESVVSREHTIESDSSQEVYNDTLVIRDSISDIREVSTTAEPTPTGVSQMVRAINSSREFAVATSELGIENAVAQSFFSQPFPCIYESISANENKFVSQRYKDSQASGQRLLRNQLDTEFRSIKLFRPKKKIAIAINRNAVTDEVHVGVMAQAEILEPPQIVTFKLRGNAIHGLSAGELAIQAAYFITHGRSADLHLLLTNPFIENLNEDIQ